MQNTFEFVLPRGYVDAAGQVHREGCIRLASALDEIQAVSDTRVQANEAYLPIVLLSSVIVRLGTLQAITPRVLEQLFAADLAYLEDLYLRLNSYESVLVDAVCPQCNARFQLQVAPLGNSE
ncbi:MAG: phage tail assembly protein [Anaerolineae bacterium]|nr:phage tail assembly protein [Anaerolineae bacterium]